MQSVLRDDFALTASTSCNRSRDLVFYPVSSQLAERSRFRILDNAVYGYLRLALRVIFDGYINTFIRKTQWV